MPTLMLSQHMSGAGAGGGTWLSEDGFGGKKESQKCKKKKKKVSSRDYVRKYFNVQHHAFPYCFMRDFDGFCAKFSSVN